MDHQDLCFQLFMVGMQKLTLSMSKLKSLLEYQLVLNFNASNKVNQLNMSSQWNPDRINNKKHLTMTQLLNNKPLSRWDKSIKMQEILFKIIYSDRLLWQVHKCLSTSQTTMSWPWVNNAIPQLTWKVKVISINTRNHRTKDFQFQNINEHACSKKPVQHTKQGLGIPLLSIQLLSPKENSSNNSMVDTFRGCKQSIEKKA